MEELRKIQNELVVPKSLRNKFGNYDYRSAELILEALKPLLLKHKCLLTLTDEMVAVLDRVYVKATATLRNSEGAVVEVHGFAREALTKKGMDESQITGSSSSYSRKYALNGMFAIDDTKDADATNKHGQGTTAPVQPKPQAPPGAPKITTELRTEILALLMNDIFSAAEQEKGAAFVDSPDTTADNARKFLAVIKDRVAQQPASKVTPKEKLIEDTISTAMIEWGCTEDTATAGICEKSGKFSMSIMTVVELKKMLKGIEDGTITP